MENVTPSLEGVKRADGVGCPRPSGVASAGDGSTPGRASPGTNSFPSLKEGTGRETNLRLVSAADLLAEKAEPLRWIWDPFLPEGTLALLAAFMKVGKSTFAYALAVAVAQGRSFLGYPTAGCGVAILAVEEHARDVKRRLRRFGLRDTDPLWVHSGELRNFPETIAQLKANIRAKSIKLVIVDTAARFWMLNDENNNADMERQVSPLLNLARCTQAVVLLIHHERKAGGEGGRGIRGGSALLGLVDQALTLTRPQGPASPLRVLEAVGRYSETPAKIQFELEGDVYLLLPTPDAVRSAVWAALSNVPQSRVDLAGKIGLSEKVIRPALVHLGSQVVKEGKGVKGDPYVYRRASPDSILSTSTPIGQETNSADGTARLIADTEAIAGNGCPPGRAAGKPPRQCPDFNLIPDSQTWRRRSDKS